MISAARCVTDQTACTSGRSPASPLADPVQTLLVTLARTLLVTPSQLGTDQFDADKSLHNQARFLPIDEKRVETYTEAMRRGDQFPPVLAHGRMGKLVMAGGNLPTASGRGNSVSRAPRTRGASVPLRAARVRR